ncbi:sensor histidine kinase [Microcella humidisoli]|uniref:histidine kinase n=1 Tax=Microcella humidisoli TaxID=2963406 RepID=A0ABY5FTX9_9MICO|nr:sensor histidine kinase [Microcella humidisoli]UTT61579.1 sensor histidine kinase [Microcella humidisoli]
MTTAPAAPAPAAVPAVADSWSYGALWRRVPRALGYLLPTFVIAITVSVALSSFVSTAVSLLIVIVGIYLLALTLLLARYTGTFEVIRLRWSGETPITEPAWPNDPSIVWWKRWLRPLANGRYWLSLLHGAIVAPIIATLSFIVVTVWLSLIAASIAVPIRVAFFDLDRWVIEGRDGGSWVIPNEWVENFAPVAVIVAIVLGVIALVTLPYVLRGLTWLHAAIARPFLGRFTNEQLEQQVSSLFTSRQAAVAAEGSALRRIERDIHDGPQQRLIRLQMDLAAAERRLAENPDEAAGLIQDARRQAQDALDELRNLSRGFAPPLLLDRGLFAALESLATRSSIPVTLETELGATANLPDEVARNAYFVASELIANAAKHSQASAITLSVTTVDGALVVAVTDDGVGGAVESVGHGLAGLRDRAAGMGGTFEISSPDGGPTTVRVALPLAGVGSASLAPADGSEPSA